MASHWASRAKQAGECKEKLVPKIMEKLRIINPKMIFKDDPDDYDFHSCGKLRYVDPQFVEEGEIKRVTAVSQDFAKKLEERRKLIERGNYIKIVSW